MKKIATGIYKAELFGFETVINEIDKEVVVKLPSGNIARHIYYNTPSIHDIEMLGVKLSHLNTVYAGFKN